MTTIITKCFTSSLALLRLGFPLSVNRPPCALGDRLDLPAGVRHNAAVGPEGVVCLEARR
jgi:hypothetical protein